MNKIVFPLNGQAQGSRVGDLQAALHFFIDRSLLLSHDPSHRREILILLLREKAKQQYADATTRLVSLFQEAHQLPTHGDVDEPTAAAINQLLEDKTRNGQAAEFSVSGVVRYSDGIPATGIHISVYDRDLRREQLLGQATGDKQGGYLIHYAACQFLRAEKGSADLVVKAYTREGALLATSEIQFNAPATAEINLTIPADAARAPALFDRITQMITPLLEGIHIRDLEQDQSHQDVSFLSGETGFDQTTLARFVLAHRQADAHLPAEFWFVVFGGAFYQFRPELSLSAQRSDLVERLPTLDAPALRKAFRRSVNRHDIAAALQKQVKGWIETFLQLTARQAVGEGGQDTFLKAALVDAKIKDAKAQQSFARLLQQHGGLTSELLDALAQDKSFKPAQIADLRTSYQLNELTQGDFSIVKAIKSEFGLRQPEQIRPLAKKSVSEWVSLVEAGHAKGTITLPFQARTIVGKDNLPEAEIYGRTLERRFREAFPTTAFAGGLARAIKKGGAKGLRQSKALGQFLELHPDFEILTTPIDDFFQHNLHPEFRARAQGGAQEQSFRTELKAVQRVFKLTPDFDSTHTLLADDVHSAQQVYRLGQSEFVRHYEKKPGFSRESATLTWNRAADTHAAVLTIVADLKSLESEALPQVLQNNNQMLSTFPNWNNLFQAGDVCECESCRSVLSPAAYFADLLLFLKDRKAKNPAHTTKDILFSRRADLGYLELNCDNALTPLPYIDVVCEVLEAAVDSTGSNDLALAGFTTMPASDAAAQSAVLAAFTTAQVSLGDSFSLTQVDTANPNLWVVHGDAATYLLKKKAPSTNFFAQILPNTKASADELRAYPQYVNPKAYERLRGVKYPLSLPFDLFGEEVRAAGQKSNLARWDLMATLRGTSAPNNPSDGDIAAEYFNISCDPSAAFDEKSLILSAAASIAAQQTLWGESGANWLTSVGNVKNFLQKTSLDYEDLLALLDLKFINPHGDITVHHLDASCDTDQKVIQVLNATKFDRIHRFLRLWRKLDGWEMWELDLVLRHLATATAVLDEPFLVKLFYFCQLRSRLGSKVSVEQVCALFHPLNIDTTFTELYEKRSDALYQRLFVNKRLINPVDPAFQIADGATDLPAGATLSDPAHLTVIMAALGIREADLTVYKTLTKVSNGLPYINDDLNLANLSFIWRHSWLAKLFKFKSDEWATILKLLPTDLNVFSDPKSAWQFVQRLDQVKASGFSVDELNWLLSADRSAKAVNETKATQFLTTLRKDVQAIQASYDPVQYSFLTAVPPSDIDSLATLLNALLLQLNRDDAAAQFFIATLRNEVAQQQIIAGLPANFDFPPAIRSSIQIHYDADTTTLRFSGLMTPAEKTTLLTDATLASVTGIAAYQDAINGFYSAPRLALKFFMPVFTAPLASLPAAVDFKSLADAALALKVSFDAEQHLLQVTGILSRDDKAALDNLSSDAAYRSAVNSVYTQPVSGVFPAEQIWLLDSDLQLPLRDLVTPANDHLAVNLATAVNQALSYLTKTLSENAVIQSSSTELGITEAQASQLLTQYAVLPDSLLKHLTVTFAATSGVVDLATLPTTFNAWFWATRVALLLNRWKMTLSEMQVTTALAGPAQLLDLLGLPLSSSGSIAPIDRLLRSSRLIRLRDSLPETTVTLLDLLQRLQSEVVTAGTYPATAFATDVEGLNDAWAAADVLALTGAVDLAYPADYLLAENWERVRHAFDFLSNLDASVATVKTFAATTMSFAHAKAIKDLLRAKFGAETWLSLSGDIQDVLRERKRDALAAYLLSQPQPANVPSGKWENSNDLYGYYLLDVEMCSCQLTSRLVQGSGSVQLFVQRCFMGLEPDVAVIAGGDTGDSAWNWWSWMSKYRVWEANRKVFLWPENWIAPELKKDRSSFFKDLENELMQNDIDQYSAETAFSNYLEKLDGVAQLEVAAFYHEDDGDNAILHVFGRTSGTEPHLYYYRSYDYRQWTPWEKVELEIQGDYLIPAVINKRVFLFWPVFTEVPDDSGNSTVTIPAATTSAHSFTPDKTKKKLQLQMAVSDYRQGKWTPKKVSKDYDISGSFEVAIVKKHYVFTIVDRSDIDGRFGIAYRGQSLGSDGQDQAYLSGFFDITGCKGVPVLGVGQGGHFSPAIRPEAASTGDETAFLKWEELGKTDEFGNAESRQDAPDNDFSLQNFSLYATNTPSITEVLVQTPWFFKMTPPWHLSYFDKLWIDMPSNFMPQFASEKSSPVGSWLPFFYNDKKRTFFVLPTLQTRQQSADDPNQIETIRAYYPEIKKEFRAAEDFFKGLVMTWLAGTDLSVLTAAERSGLEQFLWQSFPEEVAPPYSDDQIKSLIVRWYMGYIHYFLSILSIALFQDRKFHFKNNYHPFVCDFAKLVYNPLKGIPALMSRETQLQDSGFSFSQSYQPTAAVVKLPPQYPALPDCYPREVVDFTPDGAYACYNWELFYHAPLLIANALSQNQRFSEARDWYHFIFNPIGVESTTPGGSAMSKYWITKPFFETTDAQYIQQRIDNILLMLAGDTSVSGYSTQAKNDLEGQVLDWRTNPFEPHRIANYRTVAYQKTVLMKYLDNLIAWGDNLFMQDSMESINEATQLYVMAAEILGPRPKKVPPQAKPPLESFNELESHLDSFANALVEVENFIPQPSGNGPSGADQAPLPMLYFCIPQNDQMLGYWDTIADRLYKIRHCMNIEGVVRQLALFEPPIDPGALVKAVAGGMSISGALADLNAPLPLYRFNVLLQKANEVCNDVKALGSALLVALEKKDAEALNLLRQGQEIRLLDAVKAVRETQLDDAKANLDAIKKSKVVVETRRNYYRDIEKIISQEKLQLNKMALAHTLSDTAQEVKLAASIISYIPAIDIGASGFGGSPVAKFKIGGLELGQAAGLASDVLSCLAQIASNDSAMAATNAGFERRWNDWKLQESLANKELDQFDQQIAVAELRISIAEKELANHVIQIENAKATDAFMRSKYTNQDLYQWQIGQVSGVYFQQYKLAFDLAKRAERCYRFELGVQDSSYIQFGYWDSLKKGLLSGEKLQYDLRRLENAYLTQNRREYELTKHVSLALIDPLALIKLRETGRCFINLPEELFDLDFPGHYFRRIKSVSLTLPCVAGPYTTISCTLRLLKNSIRVNASLTGDNGYPRNTDEQGLPADDDRFIENNIPVKAIAASNGQNDSGVFELSFRDERYLPFEGAGTVSQWSLELFNDLPANNPDLGKPLRQFDYDTITDAIVHIKYTAREDAGLFKNGAINHLRDYYTADQATPELKLFNLRQEFPTQWYRFLTPVNAAAGNVFELEMASDLFRMLDRNKSLKVNRIWLLARCTDAGSYAITMTPPLPVPPPVGSNKITLAKVDQFGGLHANGELGKDVSALGIQIDPTDPPLKWHLQMTRPGGGNLQAGELSDLMLVLGYEWV